MRRERQPRARSRRVLDRALRAASGGGISTVQAGEHGLRALSGAARRCRPALPRSEASGVSACRSRVIAADSSCGQASAGPAEAHAQPSVRSGLWRDLTMARTGRGGAGGIGTYKGRAPHVSGRAPRAPAHLPPAARRRSSRPVELLSTCESRKKPSSGPGEGGRRPAARVKPRHWTCGSSANRSQRQGSAGQKLPRTGT